MNSSFCATHRVLTPAIGQARAKKHHPKLDTVTGVLWCVLQAHFLNEACLRTARPPAMCLLHTKARDWARQRYHVSNTLWTACNPLRLLACRQQPWVCRAPAAAAVSAVAAAAYPPPPLPPPLRLPPPLQLLQACKRAVPESAHTAAAQTSVHMATVCAWSARALTTRKGVFPSFPGSLGIGFTYVSSSLSFCLGCVVCARDLCRIKVPRSSASHIGYASANHTLQQPKLTSQAKRFAVCAQSR